MLKRIAITGVFAAAIAAGLLGISERSSQPARAAPLNALVINQTTCFLLGTAFGGGPALECPLDGNVSQFAVPTNIQNLANRLAGRASGDPTLPTYNDFKGFDLDRNMMQDANNAAPLYVVAFLNGHGRVDVSVTNGTILTENANPVAANVGHHWVCNTEAPDTNGDPDCVTNPSTPALAKLQNNLLTFAIKRDASTVRGPGVITVVQDRVPIDIPFQVVGAPFSLSLTVLKKTLGAGAVDFSPFKTPSTADDCKLAASAKGFLDANGTAERTVLLGIAKDSDGTAITGASIYWTTDNPDIAKPATNFTPTLDLGSFGTGAPNILCGTKGPGTTTIHGETVVTAPAGTAAAGLTVDPGGADVKGQSDITVVGPPATMTLASDPVTADCNGINKVAINATVKDASGGSAADGTLVNFSVVALGTVDPLSAKTTKGVATTTLVPLSATGGTKGVTVNATTTNDLTGEQFATGFAVPCTGAAGAAVTGPGGVPAAPGGGAGPTSAAPLGVIRGPNTGSGGDSVGAGTLSWWPALALAFAAAGLAMGRAALARVIVKKQR